MLDVKANTQLCNMEDICQPALAPCRCQNTQVAPYYYIGPLTSKGDRVQSI